MLILKFWFGHPASPSLIPFCLWFHSSSNVAVIYLRRARVIESDLEKKNHTLLFLKSIIVWISPLIFIALFFFLHKFVHFYYTINFLKKIRVQIFSGQKIFK